RKKLSRAGGRCRFLA
ncbi:TetW-regulatory peptide, partial [Dysosmobacter welbionis]